MFSCLNEISICFQFALIIPPQLYLQKKKLSFARSQQKNGLYSHSNFNVKWFSYCVLFEALNSMID